MCFSGLYWHAKTTDKTTGETTRLKDSIDNLVRSPIWGELYSSISNAYHSGATWENFFDAMSEHVDLDGENSARKTLNVKSDATWKDIKSAHRRLAKELHPDKGGDPAKFMEMQDAFERLKKKEDQKKSALVVVVMVVVVVVVVVAATTVEVVTVMRKQQREKRTTKQKLSKPKTPKSYVRQNKKHQPEHNRNKKLNEKVRPHTRRKRKGRKKEKKRPEVTICDVECQCQPTHICLQMIRGAHVHVEGSYYSTKVFVSHPRLHVVH